MSLNIADMLAELEADELLNKRCNFEINNTRNNNKGFLIAAADCETDPFGERDENGNLLDVSPFSWGIEIENGEYYEFWGDDCTQQFLKFLSEYDYRLEIFAHNGGKFDWIFLLRLGIVTGEPKIINGRLVSAYIFEGRHKIRDSYAMLPVPLKALGENGVDKLDIDYHLMRRENREQHKVEILKYLHRDCTVLLNIVQKFIAEFGNKITIGGAALSKLKALHPFEKIDKQSDALIRPYYIGGRVQCFELGECKGDLKVYDVNSMYPYVMATEKHPTFENHIVIPFPPLNVLDKKGNLKSGNPYFITVEGEFIGERGHFPTKTKTGLDFSVMQGIFNITHHELQCALKYNQFRIDKIHEIIECPNTINFKTFVETYVADKIRYDIEGNAAMRLFTKLVLNSAYGKFGQNADNFFDYMIVESWDDMSVELTNQELMCDWFGMEYEKDGVMPEITDEQKEMAINGGLLLWEMYPYMTNEIYAIYRKPIQDNEGALNDCFVAASITGASRTVLMEALITATRPIYCDTDSVICEELDSDHVTFHSTDLGAWDLEASGDCIYVYGKKVYALYKDGAPFADKKGKQKTANKGVRMSAEDIRSLVMEENLLWSADKQSFVFRWENEAPSYKLDGSHTFIVREILSLPELKKRKEIAQKSCLKN